MSRFNPTEELAAETPGDTPCPLCGQRAPRTFAKRAQLLGWQSDSVTYRCVDCRLRILLTTDATRVY